MDSKADGDPPVSRCGVIKELDLIWVGCCQECRTERSLGRGRWNWGWIPTSSWILMFFVTFSHPPSFHNLADNTSAQVWNMSSLATNRYGTERDREWQSSRRSTGMQARETGTGLVEYLILKNFITGMLGKNSLWFSFLWSFELAVYSFWAT